MLLVDLQQTAELETALFGNGRLLYTHQVSGPADLTLWLLRTRAQAPPVWRAAETRLITSLNVEGWLDNFADGSVESLHVVTPRDGQLALTACRSVDRRRYQSGEQSLLFRLDQATVTVATSPHPPGPVMETTKVWRTRCKR